MKKNFVLIGVVMVIAAAALAIDIHLAGFAGIAAVAAVVNLLPVPAQDLSGYKYPSGAFVEVVQGDGTVFHNIRVATDVSALLTATDGTGFGLAPVGTTIVQSFAGAGHIFIKETDDTWTTL